MSVLVVIANGVPILLSVPLILFIRAWRKNTAPPGEKILFGLLRQHS